MMKDMKNITLTGHIEGKRDIGMLSTYLTALCECMAESGGKSKEKNGKIYTR